MVSLKVSEGRLQIGIACVDLLCIFVILISADRKEYDCLQYCQVTGDCLELGECPWLIPAWLRDLIEREIAKHDLLPDKE